MINNYTEFEKLIEEYKSNEIRKKLLLHSCCGPCSSYVIDFLKDYFDLTIYYFNPNIDPLEEYEKRLENQFKIRDALDKNIPIIKGKYDPSLFLEKVKGYEEDKEGGHRCDLCIELRLEETAKKAKELNFDYFTTTLSISPFKNSNHINEIGFKLADKYQIDFLYSNFKKKDGYKKSIILSNKYDLYRQVYCGCIYSCKIKNN